jgi:molybdopterin-guanine dinucleotide biosynthesis protein A
MHNSSNIKLTGIILAGGKGLRLGRNKGLAKLHGRHMIEYVIENLSQICDEILISSNTTQCERFGFPTIKDIYTQKGPMAGIHACLKASSNEHNFVISVDTPFVSRPFIEFMLSQKKEKMIAVPWYGKDHYEPLCGYYNKSVLETMESFFEKGNYKLPDLFQAVPFSAVMISHDFPGYHPMLFHNINTEEDLQLAEKYLKNAQK